MKKGDKLIVVFGVIILILAAIGIYYWVEKEIKEPIADVEDLFSVSSSSGTSPASRCAGVASLHGQSDPPQKPALITTTACIYSSNG